jgi:hypothetical protein
MLGGKEPRTQTAVDTKGANSSTLQQHCLRGRIVPPQGWSVRDDRQKHPVLTAHY